MLEPGRVVIVDFPGAVQSKRRPALVVSTALYHQNRPDVILAVLTTQTATATGPTDYVLQEWAQAGLNRPTAFRAYLITLAASNVIAEVGTVSQLDWQRFKIACGRRWQYDWSSDAESTWPCGATRGARRLAPRLETRIS